MMFGGPDETDREWKHELAANARFDQIVPFPFGRAFSAAIGYAGNSSAGF
jgi:hypothetical protein